MRAELVFFDGARASKAGLKRGLVAFLGLLALNAPLLCIGYQPLDNHNRGNDSVHPAALAGTFACEHSKNSQCSTVGVLLVCLLLCCAIGVHTPLIDAYTSAAYGALVGVVVYGVHNCSMLQHGRAPTTALFETAYGSAICAMAAWLVFIVVSPTHS